jgi:hypothetical protein
MVLIGDDIALDLPRMVPILYFFYSCLVSLLEDSVHLPILCFIFLDPTFIKDFSHWTIRVLLNAKYTDNSVESDASL